MFLETDTLLLDNSLQDLLRRKIVQLFLTQLLQSLSHLLMGQIQKLRANVMKEEIGPGPCLLFGRAGLQPGHDTEPAVTGIR